MSTSIKISGKTFDLAFTMDTLELIERSIENFDINSISEYARRPGAMVDILYAMAQQGEFLAGRELAESRAWFGAHIPASPKKIAELQVAVFDTITAALKMETEAEEAKEKDLVLEEIKKNGERAD